MNLQVWKWRKKRKKKQEASVHRTRKASHLYYILYISLQHCIFFSSTFYLAPNMGIKALPLIRKRYKFVKICPQGCDLPAAFRLCSSVFLAAIPLQRTDGFSLFSDLLLRGASWSHGHFGCVYSEFKNWHVFDPDGGSHDFFSFIPNVYVSVSCLSCVWLMNMLRIIKKGEKKQNKNTKFCELLLAACPVYHCPLCVDVIKVPTHKMWQFDTTVQERVVFSEYKHLQLNASRIILFLVWNLQLTFAPEREAAWKPSWCGGGGELSM